VPFLLLLRGAMCASRLCWLRVKLEQALLLALLLWRLR
jgi:hypothetical protein